MGAARENDDFQREKHRLEGTKIFNGGDVDENRHFIGVKVVTHYQNICCDIFYVAISFITSSFILKNRASSNGPTSIFRNIGSASGTPLTDSFRNKSRLRPASPCHNVQKLFVFSDENQRTNFYLNLVLLAS